MNDTTKKFQGLIFLILLCLSISVQALDIAWFEQRTPGRAEGELMVVNLKEGELWVETPSHPLEIGIVRFGDQARVILSEFDANEQEIQYGGSHDTLNVQIHQGNGSANATFKLEMPQPKHEPADSAKDSTPSKTSQLAVNTVPGSIFSSMPLVSHGDPVATQSIKSTCPSLTIKPGSLKTNINRLLNDCGAFLGEWVTYGAHIGVYTDWLITNPVVLADNNTRGLQGLLVELEHHYGLKGVRHPRLPHTIDIYKVNQQEKEK